MEIFDYNGCGVYKILNTSNGKCYIGISKHCKDRIKQHIRGLAKNNHPNKHLLSAWNKYGEKSFQFSLIEKFNLDEVDQNHVLLREIYWIEFYDSYKNGYNQSKGGDGSTFVKFSDERNKKISKAIRGRKQPWNTRGLAFNARKIVCLNTGKIYDCIMDAVEEYNTSYFAIIKSCKNKTVLSNNCLHVFAYYEDFCKIKKDDISKIVEYAKYKKDNKWVLSSDSVICLNNFEIFESGKLAAKKYHADYSYLIKCCKGMVASSGKSQTGEPLAWMFLEEYENSSKEEIAIRLKSALSNGNRAKPIKIMCVNTGEVFPNITTAAKKYNLSVMSLSRHIKSDRVWGIEPVTKEKLNWEIIS